jgi:hypothetical protein
MISAPRVESLISSPDSSQEQYAGQSEEHSMNKRLARGYIPSICAGVSILPLMFVSAVFPMQWDGIIAVTGWSTLAVAYIVHVLNRMRRDLHTGYRNWCEMHKRVHVLADGYKASECARERLIKEYNTLYAEHLLQRGAIPLVAKRARGAAADSPSGVNGSAVVVPFKTDGAA